jgi:hypothetical protein
VIVKVLMIAAVVILPLPALVLGARGVMGRRRIPSEPGERVSQLLLITLRALILLLILALSGVSLLSLIGALVEDVGPMPSLVYVFFFLDLLLGALVMLTFGRRDRRRARRSASPATR